MFRLARLSLANRAVVAMVSLVLVAFGVVAAFATKQELIPPLTLPTATITSTYPGASPQIVDREVTKTVESAISGVDGLETRTSTSNGGVSVVQAEFDYGTDIDEATSDLDEAIGQVEGELPDGVDPKVQSISTEDIPVVLLAASSDADERTLADGLDEHAVPELRGLDGVADVQVTGAREERVVVSLDKDKLAAKGLTADDVDQALKANGVSVPGGNLTTDGTTKAVEVGKSYSSVDELDDLTVLPTSAPPGGGAPKPVKLSSVAEVEERLEPVSSITRTDGKQTLGLSVIKTSDANTVDVAHAVNDEVEGIEDDLGDGAKLTVIMDQAPFIESSIEGLVTEGGIGLVFAVLVILLFLLSFRSTIVTALSIPFSVLIAVAGLYAGDYSFNILTLGALTVAIGRVVDDSIVVLENIKRHLGYGEDKRDAILAGVREVAGAITASTLTTVGVFLPIAFVGGQVGEMFRPFGVTVTIALLASLLVSLTIIPVLAYWFLKPSASSPEQRAKVEAAALEKERRSPLQRAYVPVVRWATKHRASTIAIGVLVLVVTAAGAPFLQTNFLGSMGQNYYQVSQKLPVGSSLTKTDDATKKVEAALDDVDGIDTYQVTVGGSAFGGEGFGGASTPNEATYTVSSDEDIDQTEFEDDLREKLDDLKGVGEVRLEAASGPEGSSSEIEVEVHASDPGDLKVAADRIEREMRDVKDATDVTSNLAADQPTVEVDVDRAKAARKGLSEAQIGQAVRDAFEGKDGGSVVIGGETLDVVFEEGSVPDSVTDVRDLELVSPAGGTVPVGDVATVRSVERPAEVTRDDGERSATVTATPEGDNTGAVSAAVNEKLDGIDLPDGASWELSGVSQDQEEAFRQMLMALGAAVAIVFMVMVATFRSIAQPFILLVSIPFAATGAIGLLLATNTALGVPALIGLLMLVGIVVTNAIVLIDLINQYRARGMAVREAVIEGARRRLRPILMTALATIFALLPMAFGLTGGGVFISQPLAIVVIGGLVSSTVLTLAIVPTLYTMVEGAKERRGRRRLEGPVEPDDEAPQAPASPVPATTPVDDGEPSMADLAPLAQEPEPVAAGKHQRTAPVTVTAPTQSNGHGNGNGDRPVSLGVLQVELVIRQEGDPPQR